MRVGVILYLIVASAVGPWLCCCSAASLPPPDAAAPTHAPSCCAPEAAKSDTPSDPPLTPAPPCSCQHERQPGLLAGTETPRASDGFAASLDTVNSATAESHAARIATEATGVNPCSWDDPRDILHLLHILRC